MTAEQIETLFTRRDGQFAFARWGRPIAPVAFGIEEAALPVVKGALEAVAKLAGHDMVETDPELGSNLMMFFFADWAELLDVPGMDGLVPDLAGQVERLQAAGANQYRFFRFEENGAIKAAFVFLRMDDSLRDMSAQVLALSQAVQVILLWSEDAFAEQSPLALADEALVLRPEVADVIRAAYDPVMPPAANDASHALRLAARVQVSA
ncbi:MAG: hypothetical protein ABJP44_15500 [Sulfitobacter sp.]|jgi:hypothetical protein|uniref:hypothetical protein n=1 Tax=unclassified Sulfitobacter TaxID=196795 RepID=UPI0007C21CBF|nr:MULTISPECIES: hypothetical protein [unclassified Sulfitobacter]KZX96160.1 hypothetical protein A3722_15915 [Sulfitobacter sp. HI0027]KZX97249.1 hypothetical protein A3720_18530 [Sulfitobacter sp. HI0021]KZZ02665.1 hypothetical protein A3747_14790 [Sulfitobacter sp. HI0076]MAP15504.1 hypothetical protein [Sulfitobacter sp.]HCQ58932.1 hypothetical protein [Sulfitobacter sp.]